MPRQEQLLKTRSKRTVEDVQGTFPEDFESHRAFGGGPDDTEEVLSEIDRVLETLRALGRSTGIEAA